MRSYVVPPADERLAAVDLSSAQIFGMEGAWYETTVFHGGIQYLADPGTHLAVGERADGQVI